MGSEVIEVVERRRRWSSKNRLAVLMDAIAPGASIAAVADRHVVSRNCSTRGCSWHERAAGALLQIPTKNV